MSIDKNCRHRGSDEKDSPLLLEADGAAEDGDVVIGGEQGDQAEHEAADGLQEAKAIEGEPPMPRGLGGFWRICAGLIGGVGHRIQGGGAVAGGASGKGTTDPCHRIGFLSHSRRGRPAARR
ncbi:MAG: hypothetical protein ACK55B_11460 [Cyanobacteriota bacterium]